MCLAVIKERGAPSLRADGVDRGGEDAGPRSQFRVKLTLLTVSWTNYAQELLTSPRTFVWFGGVRWWWGGRREKRKEKKKSARPQKPLMLDLAGGLCVMSLLIAFWQRLAGIQCSASLTDMFPAKLFSMLYITLCLKKNLQISHSWYVTAAVFDLQERNCWQSHDSAQCCLCS